MSEGEGGKKGGSMMKMLIMGVLGLLLVGGGGYGVMWFMKSKAKKAEAVQAEAAKGKEEGGKGAHAPEGDGHATAKAADHGDDEDEEDAHAAAGGGHGGGGAAGVAVLVLRPIVNLEGPRRNAFLKCELHILFRDPDLGKLAAGDKPSVENSQIRAMVLETLSGKTVEEARDLEFRESLRVELKEKLNAKFAPKPPKPGEKEDPKTKKPKKPIKDVLVVDWGIQD